MEREINKELFSFQENIKKPELLNLKIEPY